MNLYDLYVVYAVYDPIFFSVDVTVDVLASGTFQVEGCRSPWPP